MTDAPDLPDALASYLCATLPKPESLDQWLLSNCPAKQRRRVRAEVVSVVDEAEKLVWKESGGVRLDEAFWQRLLARLQPKHPWLTLKTVQGLQGYLGWLCWHEGLYAPDAP